MKILREHKYIVKKLNIKSNYIIEIGNEITNNNIKLYSMFDYFKIDNIDEIWTVEISPLNSFRAYLYGLSHVAYLNNAYEMTLNDKYLRKAKEFILSYINFFNNNPEIENEFSISTGTINIIHFLHLAEDKDILIKEEIDTIIDNLQFNSSYLSNMENYKFSNHGIWQDIALLSLALIENPKWKNDEIINLAIERISNQIEFNFTEEYINIENSPFYHIYNLKLFEEIKGFVDNNLGLHEKDYSKYMVIDKLSKEGRQVFNHLIRQDLSLPHLGDTEHYKEKEYKFINKSIVYEKTGLALLKGKDHFITLKSGVRGIGHKHRDELSFTIFYKGVDVLIDAGKLNYEKKDINYAIKSVYGHNGLYVNDSNYSIKVAEDKMHVKNEEISKAGIDSYNLNEEIDYVSVYNNFYNATELNRRFLLLKPNVYILLDECDSSKKNNIYTQNFNIGTEFELTNYTQNSIEFNYHKNNMKLKINQHLEYDKFELNYANKQNNKGFSSKEFNKILKNYNIGYINEGNSKYITSIQINTNDENEKSLIHLEKEDNIILLYYKEGCKFYSLEVNLKSGKSLKKACNSNEIRISKTIQFENGKIVKNGKMIKVEVDLGYDEYACYLTIGNNPTIKCGYQKSNVFIFEDISSNKDMKIKVYTKTNNKIYSETINVFKGNFDQC